MKQLKPLVKNIVILDNDILVQVKKVRGSDLILSEAVEKQFIENDFKILAVGSLVNIGEDITRIDVGQTVVLRRGMLSEASGLNVADFNYDNNAMLIQRHMIAYILLPETK